MNQDGWLANVREYGAAGNGITDDTAAIQQAVDSRTGLVFFPQGDYKISRTIEVGLAEKGKTVLRGAGARLVHHGEGPALRFTGTHLASASPDGLTDQVSDRELRPTLTEIEIMGAHETADGVRLERTHMMTFSNVLIRNCRHAIHIVGRNRNVIVSHCHIYNNRGVGIFLDDVNLHQVNIVGSHISYNAEGGIKVQHGEVRNLQITGNDIEYNNAGPESDGKDVWLVAGKGAIREGTISGNTIQALPSRRGANVWLEGLAAEGARKVGLFSITGNLITSQTRNVVLRHCMGVTVQGNTIHSQSVLRRTLGAKARFTPEMGGERNVLVEQSERIVISDNVFDANPDYGEWTVSGIEVRDSNTCTLSGNTLVSGYGGDGESGGTLEVRDSWGINLTGCTIVDPVVRGIAFHDVDDSRISECLILERRQERSMHHGMLITGGKGNLITSNRVDPGSEGAVSVGGKNSLVANNHVGDGETD
ncbi:MAG TPA: right-handed parallel beta-helix repeat-containing protein [Chloroflexota bacterium]|nr:right-handed parallel beta-helix repeat-containing protein [Chloroflexota bacterium]